MMDVDKEADKDDQGGYQGGGDGVLWRLTAGGGDNDGDIYLCGFISIAFCTFLGDKVLTIILWAVIVLIVIPSALTISSHGSHTPDQWTPHERCVQNSGARTLFKAREAF